MINPLNLIFQYPIDMAREVTIKSCLLMLKTSTTQSDSQKWCRRMINLVKQRSPQQVARMERRLERRIGRRNHA